MYTRYEVSTIKTCGQKGHSQTTMTMTDNDNDKTINNGQSGTYAKWAKYMKTANTIESLEVF